MNDTATPSSSDADAASPPARGSRAEQPRTPPPAARPTTVLVLLWSGFAVVHLALLLLAQHGSGQPLGDVTNSYVNWAADAFEDGSVVGITTSWVYPLLALLPILVAFAFGSAHYEFTWLALVTVLDAAAFAVLVGGGRVRRRVFAAAWWLCALLLLGPIAVGRIDSITMPLAIVAVTLLARHPRAAAILLAVGTWIKIWPVAVLVAVAATGRRWLVPIAAGLGETVVVGLFEWAGGGDIRTLLGFLGDQTGRGLQFESTLATPFDWAAKAGHGQVIFNAGLITFEVTGPGTAFVSSLTTVLLVVSVALSAALGLWRRRRAAPGALVPTLALQLVLCLIVFNKVGSPQFMTWLLPVVILGLLAHGRGFAFPMIGALAAAGLTQIVYPYLYTSLILLHTPELIALTLRNAWLVALLVWSTVTLVRGGPAPRVDRVVGAPATTF